MVVMADRTDDARLVERFNGGDQSAFTAIIERYSGDVSALANRLLGWPGDVDDVTQDIFLAAFLNLRKFRGDCSLRTWLFTITINKCRTHRYKRMLHLRRFSRAADRAPSTSHRPTDNSPMDSEKFSRVRRAVGALPAKYREPIVLRYLHELPTDQISRILDIKKNALHVRLSRARKLLKDELAELIEE